jgi:hypothetical protein
MDEQMLAKVMAKIQGTGSPEVVVSEPAPAVEPVVEPVVVDDTVPCDGCPGDGVYYGRGAVVNGVFQGFTGTCFRCHGKGRQTPSDVARCAAYDRHRRVAL